MNGGRIFLASERRAKFPKWNYEWHSLERIRRKEMLTLWSKCEEWPQNKAQEVARDCDKGLCRQGKDFRFYSWCNEETLKDWEQKSEMFCFTLTLWLECQEQWGCGVNRWRGKFSGFHGGSHETVMVAWIKEVTIGRVRNIKWVIYSEDKVNRFADGFEAGYEKRKWGIRADNTVLVLAIEWKMVAFTE